MLNSINVDSCSCIPEYYNFKGGVKNSEIVIHAKVLGRFAHPKHINGPEKKYIRYISIVKLEILENLNGVDLPKFIYFKNGSSASCELSIFQFDIGEELLLKAHKSKIFILTEEMYSEYVEIENNSKFLNFNVGAEDILIEAGSCGFNYLVIENNIVRGNLTRNKGRRKARCAKLIGKISRKLESNYRDNKIRDKDNLQYMEIEKYKNILKRKTL